VQLIFRNDRREYFVIVLADADNSSYVLKCVSGDCPEVRSLKPGQPGRVKEPAVGAEHDRASVKYPAEAQKVDEEIHCRVRAADQSRPTCANTDGAIGYRRNPNAQCETHLAH